MKVFNVSLKKSTWAVSWLPILKRRWEWFSHMLCSCNIAYSEWRIIVYMFSSFRQSTLHLLFYLIHFNINFLNISLMNCKSIFLRRYLTEVLCKKCVLKFLKINRKTPVPQTLFIKLAGLRLATLLKWDSGPGVFLWILRDFLEHLFL